MSKAKAQKKRKQPSVGADVMNDLVARASEVRKNAHAPYSKYKVGAAILTRSGKVFTGCNVENASFGATICAERGAVMQMIAAGEREPIACAVVTHAMPMALVGTQDPASTQVVDLADLLPLMFELR